MAVDRQIGKTAKRLRVLAEGRLINIFPFARGDFLGRNSRPDRTELPLRLKYSTPQDFFRKFEINHDFLKLKPGAAYLSTSSLRRRLS